MRIIIRTYLVCLLLASTTVHAAEWTIDPTIRFRAGYDDNVRLRTSNKVSSAEATFSPGAVFSVETPTSGASGKLRFDFHRYEKDSDLNENNVSFNISSFHSLERSRLGLNVDFIKDTTLDSQLEATGLALDRVNRQSFLVSPDWTYTFGERTRLNVSYSYRDVEYKNAGNSAFVNYTLNTAQASLTRILNERSTASITLSRTRSDNDNDVESTNTNLQGGASYRLTETLSASLFIGVRRTEVNVTRTRNIISFSGNTITVISVNENTSNSDWGSTFSASITKTFLRGEIGLSGSRDISNDINGEPIEVIRLRLTNLYRLSEILSAKLNLEFYNSDASSSTTTRLNRDYYQVEPAFTWKLKKFWSLSGSYRYRKQTFDNISDDAIQNAAYLTLTYRWPRIAVSR